jgi:hypothetical protein
MHHAKHIREKAQIAPITSENRRQLHQLNRRIDVPQSRTGHFAELKICLAFAWNESTIPQFVFS